MVAKALQSPSTGAHDTETSAKLLIGQLQSMRTDENAKKMYTDAVQAGEQLCLAPAVPKQFVFVRRELHSQLRLLWKKAGTNRSSKPSIRQLLNSAVDLISQIYIKSRSWKASY